MRHARRPDSTMAGVFNQNIDGCLEGGDRQIRPVARRSHAAWLDARWPRTSRR